MARRRQQESRSGAGVRDDVDEPHAITVHLDEVLAEHALAKVDLLKIDIESAEKELFEGSLDSAWLQDVSVIMIELHDRLKPGCSSAFYRAVSQFEFSQHVVGEVVVVSRLPGRSPDPVPVGPS